MGVRKQFIKNIVLPAQPCAAGFNNNNNNNDRVVSGSSSLNGVCLSVTLHIVDLWQYYAVQDMV